LIGDYEMSLTKVDMQKTFAIISEYRKKLDLSVKIPLEEYRKRYKAVWSYLEEHSIDLGFFFWYREMPGDGIYLTGYNPTIERASGLIAPGKPPIILAGPESGILSKEVGLNLPTYFVEEFSISDEYYEGIEYDSIKHVIDGYVGNNITKIGILTPDDYVPARFIKILQKDIVDGVEVVDASDILTDLRYEKSDNEMKCMQQASVIATAALRSMLSVLQPGIRETEVAAIGDFVIKALGGSGYGFDTIVNSGHRCTTVIGPASNKIIKKGEIVQLGCSPSYEGYKGVSRRAVVMGERNEIQKQYFAVMNTGYEKAANKLREVVEQDLPNNEIDLAARDYFNTQKIDGQNMKQFHFYSTCHGTGLTECLEPMVIHPEKKQYYGKNVGIMLDLGVYGYPHPDICGGCVEDAYFKKGNELIKFSDLPIDVQSMVGSKTIDD
jgi:Xaa-Pro aminopeptidase